MSFKVWWIMLGRRRLPISIKISTYVVNRDNKGFCQMVLYRCDFRRQPFFSPFLSVSYFWFLSTRVGRWVKYREMMTLCKIRETVVLIQHNYVSLELVKFFKRSRTWIVEVIVTFFLELRFRQLLSFFQWPNEGITTRTTVFKINVFL